MVERKRSHLPRVLRAARIVMLVLVTLVVIAATSAAIAESYNGLYNWALEHQFATGWEANIAPLMVDTFIITGEAMLFVLIVDRRHVRWIWIPVAFSTAGLTLSFVGNVDRLQHADVQTRIGHGLAPIAAAAGLLGAMVLLHLIAGDYSALIPAAEPAKKTKSAWQRPWPKRARRIRQLAWLHRRRAVTPLPAPAITPPPVQPVVSQEAAPKPAAPSKPVQERSVAPKAGSRNNTPPTAQQLDQVRDYLRQLAPGTKMPIDRDLAARFFEGRQRRAMKRVLDEDEFVALARGDSSLIKLPARPYLVPGKAVGDD